MKYNVIMMNMDGTVKYYDIVPYFEEEWKKRPYIYNDGTRVKVSTYEDFRKWFESTGRYRFWSRCEYEFVAVPWPYKSGIAVENQPCVKLDVWDQIEMNSDVISKLMWDEFTKIK